MNRILSLFGNHVVRYLFSGGTAAATNLVILFVLTHYVQLHYLVSGVIAFCIAVIVSFVLQKKWTFSDHSNNETEKKFAVFLLVALINLGLNTMFLYFFTDICGLHYLASQFLASGILAVWSYYIYKKIFRTA